MLKAILYIIIIVYKVTFFSKKVSPLNEVIGPDPNQPLRAWKVQPILPGIPSFGAFLPTPPGLPSFAPESA